MSEDEAARIIEIARKRYQALLEQASTADTRAFLEYCRARAAARVAGTLEDFERRARPAGTVAELIDAEAALAQTRIDIEALAA